MDRIRRRRGTSGRDDSFIIPGALEGSVARRSVKRRPLWADGTIVSKDGEYGPFRVNINGRANDIYPVYQTGEDNTIEKGDRVRVVFTYRNQNCPQILTPLRESHEGGPFGGRGFFEEEDEPIPVIVQWPTKFGGYNRARNTTDEGGDLTGEASSLFAVIGISPIVFATDIGGEPTSCVAWNKAGGTIQVYNRGPEGIDAPVLIWEGLPDLGGYFVSPTLAFANDVIWVAGTTGDSKSSKVAGYSPIDGSEIYAPFSTFVSGTLLGFYPDQFVVSNGLKAFTMSNDPSTIDIAVPAEQTIGAKLFQMSEGGVEIIPFSYPGHPYRQLGPSGESADRIVFLGAVLGESFIFPGHANSQFAGSSAVRAVDPETGIVQWTAGYSNTELLPESSKTGDALWLYTQANAFTKCGSGHGLYRKLNRYSVEAAFDERVLALRITARDNSSVQKESYDILASPSTLYTNLVPHFDGGYSPTQVASILSGYSRSNQVFHPRVDGNSDYSLGSEGAADASQVAIEHWEVYNENTGSPVSTLSIPRKFTLSEERYHLVGGSGASVSTVVQGDTLNLGSAEGILWPEAGPQSIREHGYFRGQDRYNGFRAELQTNNSTTPAPLNNLLVAVSSESKSSPGNYHTGFCFILSQATWPDGLDPYPEEDIPGQGPGRVNYATAEHWDMTLNNASCYDRNGYDNYGFSLHQTILATAQNNPAENGCYVVENTSPFTVVSIGSLSVGSCVIATGPTHEFPPVQLVFQMVEPNVWEPQCALGTQDIFRRGGGFNRNEAALVSGEVSGGSLVLNFNSPDEVYNNTYVVWCATPRKVNVVKRDNVWTQPKFFCIVDDLAIFAQGINSSNGLRRVSAYTWPNLGNTWNTDLGFDIVNIVGYNDRIHVIGSAGDLAILSSTGAILHTESFGGSSFEAYGGAAGLSRLYIPTVGNLYEVE